MTSFVALLLLSCTGSKPGDSGAADDSGADDSGAGGLAPVETLAIAQALASKGVDAWPAEHQLRDWMQTVWVFGLLALDDADGGRVGHDYADVWMADWLPELQAQLAAGDAPFESSDSTSPAIIAAALDDDAYAEIVAQSDQWVRTDAPRTAGGAWEHWGPDAPFGVPDQVWIDSMFMLGQYSIERYRATGDAAWADLFTTQYLLFSDLCRDPADQLYRHAWDEPSGDNIPTEAVYWNRGNSWVLYVGVEALLVFGPDADPALADAVNAHARAVAALQDPETGLWHTVLNSPRGADPDNYVETSGSALLATSIARGVRGGVLDPDLGQVVRPAVDGVLAMIDDDADGPVLTGTSFGTNPGEYEMYVSVVTIDDLILGVGAAVLFLSQVDGWEQP
ncbi:MAG: glycoside hydrolase family 88 protein [Alphaproteobacteria bacterium]|nr:glycoside hydrolase family 88 protein [Alphaproteobacteria bacterium]